MYKSSYKFFSNLLFLITTMCICLQLSAQNVSKPTGQAKPATLYRNLTYAQLVDAFKRPPESAKPWVFWY